MPKAAAPSPVLEQVHMPGPGKSNYSADWILHTLSPINEEPNGFDATLADWLEVSVCEAPAAEGCTVLEQFDASNGGIHLMNGFYRINWGPFHSLVGTPLEARFSVAGLPIGFALHTPDSNGVVPLKFRIDGHPLIRARILRLQGLDAVDVARMLNAEFRLGSLETTRILAREGYAPIDIGRVLLNSYNESAIDAAWLLRVAGVGADAVAIVLRDVYVQSPGVSGMILREVGYSCIEIAGASRELAGSDPTTAVAFLDAADCAPDEDCFFPEGQASEPIVLREQLVDSLSTVLTLLPPIAGATDEFDRTLLEHLRIAVFEVASDGSRTLVDELSSTGGMGPNNIRLHNNFYKVNWSPWQSDTDYELRVRVPGLDVAYFEYSAATPRTLPIKFRIDSHPVVRARVLFAAGASSAEAVAALLQEFPIGPSEAVRILYEEMVDDVEVAVALRDGLLLGPIGVAEAFREARIPVPSVIRALEGAFGSPVDETVATLKSAGYPAVQVWDGLDTVFDLEDNEIERLLRDSGYTEAEVLEALAPRLLTKYACLIDESGPKIYFYPGEPYLPSSVEWFAGVSSLVWGYGDVECPGCRLAPGEVTVDNLTEVVEDIRIATGQDYDFWFDLPEPSENPVARGGDLGNAKLYVHAVRLRDLGVTDLQFWLYYPYNGPGSFTVETDLIGLDVCRNITDKANVAPLGEHESDWEVIVLRFDDATNELTDVFLSAHGDYIGYPAPLVEREDGDHVVAYSAFNGHAFFPFQGRNKHTEGFLDFEVGHIELMTLNWAARGQSLRAWENYEFIGLDGTPLDTPWLHFDGVWGETRAFNLTDDEKADIIRAVADDCMLAIRIIGIPLAAGIAALGLCTGVCAVAAAPCLFGYFGCFAGCMGVCVPTTTKALIIAGEIAYDPLLASYAPLILDKAFSDQEGTGKPTPSFRGQEWRHFRLPNENPDIISISDTGMPGNPMRQVVVSIPDQVCERKGEPWGLGPPLCVDTPEVSTVELGVDGVYTDITRTEVDVGSGKNYTFDWDTTAGDDDLFVLSPRYANPDGIVFEYTDRTEIDLGSTVVDVNLTLDSDLIAESETARLSGTIDSGDAFDLTIDWGDGSAPDVLAGAAGSFGATHVYEDDGAFNIVVTSSASFATIRIVVLNQDPTIDSTTVQPGFPAILNVGDTLRVDAGFSDIGTLDTHAVSWDWGDGTVDVQPGAMSPVTATHGYSTPGVFRPSVTVEDDDGGDTRVDLPISVATDSNTDSGIGRILVPIGDAVEAQATFDFDLMYDTQGNAISNLSYTIGGLVVTGIDNPTASVSGSSVVIEGGGLINGRDSTPDLEPYRIRVTAEDGVEDTFRLRLWFPTVLDGVPVDQVIYETADGQVLDSGSVTIDMMGNVTGMGTILASDPTAVDLVQATFGFAHHVDGMGVTLFDLRISVDDLLISGIGNPVVTSGAGTIEVEGDALINNEPATDLGEMFRISLSATDAATDTFDFKVWFTDVNGDEQVVYESQDDQEILTGEINLQP